MDRVKHKKPLGRKAYGSIGHLPNSRLGPKDYCIHEGQARILTEKARDRHDTIIVQEKLDGSCVAVALLDGVIHSLGRAGYPANTSPYEQHHLFADWVIENEDRFRKVLREGDRIVGEWLCQAHGTKYRLEGRYGHEYARQEPFAPFDIMHGAERMTREPFLDRVDGLFDCPCTLHTGGPICVEEAMDIHRMHHLAYRQGEELEGVVYRVERKGEVDFLAKWVRPGKVDGKYLPEISGGEPVWNWRP